jgi:hypothetical protein
VQVLGIAIFAMDERSARLAESETIFRAGNERIDALVGSGEGPVPYLCECGDPGCFEPVLLTSAEYELVRAHAARFVVVAGHQDLSAGEVVVEEQARFTIVKKRGAEGELVERTNPRDV